jgi:hypothetical protein
MAPRLAGVTHPVWGVRPAAGLPSVALSLVHGRAGHRSLGSGISLS